MTDKVTRFRDIPQFTRRAPYAVDLPPDYLIKKIDEYVRDFGLQLIPEFQRGHVWTEKQQIAFIEFFLRGGITGRDIYLNNPSWRTSVPDGEYNEFVCVDGLQRVTAWKRFINNEIPVFGSYYNEFTDRFDVTRTMRLHINDLKTEKEVIRWYLEMNSGGTPHCEEELSRVRGVLSRLENPSDDSGCVSGHDEYAAHVKFYNKALEDFRKRKELLKNARPSPFEVSNEVITIFVDGSATSAGHSGFSLQDISLEKGDIFYVPEKWRLEDAGMGGYGQHARIAYKAGGDMNFSQIVCSIDKALSAGEDDFMDAASMPKEYARIIIRITEVKRFDDSNKTVYEVNFEIAAPVNSASVF